MTVAVPAPTVSAVVIFCNEEHHLAEAVESVLDQTYEDWELILVDDGSTDGSPELAGRLAAERPHRIRLLHHPGRRRRGMSASRNLGVGAARGRYIAYLDADDRWLPEKLSAQVDLIERHAGAAVVCGPLVLWRSWTGRPSDVDGSYGVHGDGFELATNRLYEPPELVAHFIRHKDLVPSGALFHRDVFLDVGGADESFTDNYEDAVVFAKIGLRHPIYVADESWYLYRQYPGPAETERRRRSRPDADRLRGDAARLVFLDWVEAHLADESIDDRRLSAALRDARRRIAHPHRDRLRRGIHRRVDRLARRVSGAGGRRTPRRIRAGSALAARHLGLAARGRLRRVPIAGVSDEFGFSFGRHGWHPFVALLDQTIDDETVPVTDFERFFADPAVNGVRNLNELLDLACDPLGLTSRQPFWLGTYPWGGLAAVDHNRPGPAFGWAYDQTTGASTAELWGANRTVWYRPDRHSTLSNERRLTLDLRRSIRHGYRPLRARGFPRLVVLRRSNGETRSLVIDGHHRLAVLAHLGVQSVVAEIDGVVDERKVADWYHVRSGGCSIDDALAVFGAFFELDGTERFRRVLDRTVVTS